MAPLGVRSTSALLRRERGGTPDARCVRSSCAKGGTRFSHHGHTAIIRRSARGGLPACSVLFPANGRNLSPSPPRCFGRAGRENSPDFAAPHDLGRRGPEAQNKSPMPSPAFGLQASSSADVKAAHAPPKSNRLSSAACRLRACARRPFGPRPDAAASTVMPPRRTTTIASRPSRGGMRRAYRNIVKRNLCAIGQSGCSARRFIREAPAQDHGFAGLGPASRYRNIKRVDSYRPATFRAPVKPAIRSANSECWPGAIPRSHVSVRGRAGAGPAD